MPFTDSIKMVDVVISDRELITASPIDVASGKVYIGSTAQLETGIMPVAEYNNDITLLAGETHAVPFGKIPQAYNVTAADLSGQTAGNAIAADLLVTKSAWVNGEKIIGTMPNIGKEDEELVSGESHTISYGFHDGTGVITVRTLSDQTPGTAVADDILNGKISWVNGSSVTGTMPNIGSESDSLNCGSTHTISKGYHDGTGIITANSLASQTSATATADDIVDGETAWVNGIQITGNITKISSSTEILPINGSYTIPKGYHSGNGKVTQNIETLGDQTVASAFDPQIIQTAGKYMTGNITVTGINALNYKREKAAVIDSTDTEISNYILPVIDYESTIHLNVDNWHDNATMNVYQFIFTDLIDNINNSMELDTIIAIDWGNVDTLDYTYKFGNVSIRAFLEEGTNAHSFTISGISSGKVSIIELFASRQFGDSHDVDEPI